jgi:hypothetical protein
MANHSRSDACNPLITLDASGENYSANYSYEESDLAGNSLGTTTKKSTATRITPHLPR